MECQQADVEWIAKALRAAGLAAALQPFGSTASGRQSPASDLDIAVIVPEAEKPAAVSHLRQMARSPERKANWAVDVFNSCAESFGYNHRHSATLHLLVISRTEYEGDSLLAANIRTAGQRLP